MLLPCEGPVMHSAGVIELSNEVSQGRKARSSQGSLLDVSLAAQLFRDAMEQGHITSMVPLSLLYLGYEKGFDQDIPIGLSLLRRAAECHGAPRVHALRGAICRERL